MIAVRTVLTVGKTAPRCVAGGGAQCTTYSRGPYKRLNLSGGICVNTSVFSFVCLRALFRCPQDCLTRLFASEILLSPSPNLASTLSISAIPTALFPNEVPRSSCIPLRTLHSNEASPHTHHPSPAYSVPSPAYALQLFSMDLLSPTARAPSTSQTTSSSQPAGWPSYSQCQGGPTGSSPRDTTGGARLGPLG